MSHRVAGNHNWRELNRTEAQWRASRGQRHSKLLTMDTSDIDRRIRERKERRTNTSLKGLLAIKGHAFMQKNHPEWYRRHVQNTA
jgi:hypothetical protein